MIIHQNGLRGLELPQAFIRNGGDEGRGGPQISRRAMYRELAENNTLREDQTREIDETLTRVSRRDLVAVRDLANLQKMLSKGVGATTYEFDRVAPVGEATQSMSILNLGDEDLVNFTRTAIPVPVTASRFTLDARQIAAGRSMGDSVDMVNVEEHTRSVAEKLEDSLVNGSSVVLGGNTLPGYTNHASIDTASFSSGHWNDQTAGAHSAAVADVLEMRQGLRATGFTGPYGLYVSPNFDETLDDDYKANSDRTLRERLLSIEGVQFVKVLPSLADDHALMVQLTRSVVEYAVGQPITTVTWTSMGGLATHWAILHVGTFAIRVANARAPLSNGTLPALTTATGISYLS
jgi:uncharacterized linocin/CFP29 family protein